MGELSAVEHHVGCDFSMCKNLFTSSNVIVYLCKSIDGESFFVVKSVIELELKVGDLILGLDEHFQSENQHYYMQTSKNSFKLYVDFVDQMKGLTFPSTEWKFANILNEMDILTLCWQITYLFSMYPSLNKDTLIIEKMEDGSVALRLIPIPMKTDNIADMYMKVSERLALFLLELVSIYLDLPLIPEHVHEIKTSIEMMENLPYSSNNVLIQCILPTLKSCLDVENPDFYELFTLLLLRIVNLDSHQYWTILSSLKHNVHKRTVADSWIESDKLFAQGHYEKALEAILEIKEFTTYSIIPYLTGKIYYELYRKSFYQLHYPGTVSLLDSAAQYFSRASNLSKNMNMEYVERKVECNFRKWILDNELNLDKSNQEMNELSSELDRLIESNPKSSSLYSMKSILYFIHSLRFGTLADKSHISVIITFAEVAKSNSPSDPLYQLILDLVSSMFKKSHVSGVNIETNDAKFLLIQAIICELCEQDNDQVISKLKLTDYREAVLGALWYFPMLTEEMTLAVTGNVLIAQTNDKYRSIVGKLNYKYIKDDETKVCMKCQTKFTLVTRRHHCRFCGKIFCKECSTKKIKYQKEEEKRSCENCFNFLSTEFAPLNKINDYANSNSPTIPSNKDKDLLSIDCYQFFKQQIQSVCSQPIYQTILDQ